MAIPGKDIMKKAIADRFNEVLDSAKNAEELTINVYASPEKAPVIIYNIRETIFPEADS